MTTAGDEYQAIMLATAGGGPLLPEAGELLRARRRGELTKAEFVTGVCAAALAHSDEGTEEQPPGLLGLDSLHRLNPLGAVPPGAPLPTHPEEDDHGGR